MSFIRALLITPILLSPSIVEAQTQGSLAPCSPNIVGSNNSVQTTCLLRNSRIRIAQLSGDFDDRTYARLQEFLFANDQNIIYLDVSADFSSNGDRYSKDGGLSSLTFEDPEGGGWVLNFNDDANLYFANGSYHLQGFLSRR
jgi:hypothetical protein